MPLKSYESEEGSNMNWADAFAATSFWVCVTTMVVSYFYFKYKK